MLESLIHAALGLVDSLHQLVAVLLLLAVCALAWLYGRRLERWAALAIFVASLVAPLVQDTSDWFAPQVGLMAVDVALLVFFLILAITTDRFWPMWAAGFHLLTVLAHVAVHLDGGVMPLAYVVVLNLVGYLVLLALLLGIFEGRRRARQPSA